MHTPERFDGGRVRCGSQTPRRGRGRLGVRPVHIRERAGGCPCAAHGARGEARAATAVRRRGACAAWDAADRPSVRAARAASTRAAAAARWRRARRRVPQRRRRRRRERRAPPRRGRVMPWRPLRTERLGDGPGNLGAVTPPTSPTRARAAPPRWVVANFMIDAVLFSAWPAPPPRRASRVPGRRAGRARGAPARRAPRPLPEEPELPPPDDGQRVAERLRLPTRQVLHRRFRGRRARRRAHGEHHQIRHGEQVGGRVRAGLPA